MDSGQIMILSRLIHLLLYLFLLLLLLFWVPGLRRQSWLFNLLCNLMLWWNWFCNEINFCYNLLSSCLLIGHTPFFVFICLSCIVFCHISILSLPPFLSIWLHHAFHAFSFMVLMSDLGTTEAITIWPLVSFSVYGILNTLLNNIWLRSWNLNTQCPVFTSIQNKRPHTTFQ